MAVVWGGAYLANLTDHDCKKYWYVFSVRWPMTTKSNSKNSKKIDSNNGANLFQIYFCKTSKVFHIFCAVQECQYSQLLFSCAIRNEQDQWNLESWKIICLYPLISNVTFTSITCCKCKRWELYKSYNVVFNYTVSWTPGLNAKDKHCISHCVIVKITMGGTFQDSAHSL